MYYSAFMTGLQTSLGYNCDPLLPLDMGVGYAVHTWVYTRGEIVMPAPVPIEYWVKPEKALAGNIFGKSRFAKMAYDN